MNRLLLLILIPFVLLNCSFNPNSKIWNKEDNKFEDDKNLKKINFIDKQKTIELNPSVKIDLLDVNTKENFDINQNNFGSLRYQGSLEKIANYKFTKFNNINELNFEPLFLRDSLIFFDKKGSIIHYDKKSNIIWKKNYYKKSEKKLNPKLSFYKKDKNIVVIDDIGKIYLLNSFNGDLIWMNNNTYPFNSGIKSSKGKLFGVDLNNTLRCYEIKDGSKCWKYQTESSLTLSDSKHSIIIYKDNVIFSNSLGDITSIDISSGSVDWQLPTQSNLILSKTYNYRNSKLVGDNKSVYFSNNQNQFYSANIETGIINWENKVNSSLTPVIINNFIFTISEEGFLYILQKKEGNIIKITDLYKGYKTKDRKKIKPVGFLIANEKLYLSNNNGILVIVDISTGKVIKTQKISRGPLSKPFINNNRLYIIKNGSIIEYN